jgi:hypothetical protein
MNCSFHPQNAATAYCRTCGRALCPQCQRDVRGAIYCEECIASRLGDAVPPPVTQAVGSAPPARVQGAPSPGLAAFLGFIPGVGAMYNGQFGKAFAHLMIFIGLCWASDNVNGFFGLGVAFWIFYMVFDAYRTAHARELGQPVPPDPFGFDQWWVSESARAAQASATANTAVAAGGTSGSTASAATEPAAAPPSATPVGAVLLIGLGVLFLLTNMGMVPWWGVREFWPAVLIVIGVWLFLRGRHTDACACQRCQTRGMMAPAVLVTLGVLFMLHEFRGPAHVPFHRTFPVLFIVIGAVLIIRRTASGEGHYVPPPPPGVNPPSPPALSGNEQNPAPANPEVRNG